MISKKHERRLLKLVFGFALGSIILVVSTYAWFIGMKTVNVSAFDINISAIPGLALSLNGQPNSWTNVVTISEDNYKSASYLGNTNSWGGEKGLIPMSTIGQIKFDSARLKLYQKGSFTTTPGGYRVMASEVLNSGVYEADGYVAFDLFIRNLSGNEYYEEVNIKNEEAIYLTPESSVEVVASGEREENSGIENSVRVAFAQIGRVKANSSTSTIVDITCETDDKVSGICDSRNATIWEPNDKRHVLNAISWYNASCKKRIGADLTKVESFSGQCGTIVDGKAFPTYAVSGVIDETDRVDTYDGLEYNGYTNSISTEPSKGKLLKVSTFTDTMKDLYGIERPTFMMLAPNSITKVRVYVYLEGQDIDNYDFAQYGKKIAVSFGFTKERFYGEDVEYNDFPPVGPELEDELQERPKEDSGASIIAGLCETTEECAQNGLSKDPYGDIRYVGSNPNNYIEFNGETWRIVGVFNVASKLGGRNIPRIKIVRDAFSVPMSWDSSGETINGGNGVNQWAPSTFENGNSYEGSDIMRLLNGYYLGTTNTCTYCNDYVADVCPVENNCNSIVKQLSGDALKYVDNTVWYLGGRGMTGKLPLSAMYSAERGIQSGKICDGTGRSCNDGVIRTLKWVGKVGLLYPSDFGYASADTKCANDVYGADSTCENQNWLHPTGDTVYWTISPYANTSYAVNLWGIHGTKSLSHFTVPTPYYIKPTLYLKYGTKLIGNGENNSNNIYKIV